MIILMAMAVAASPGILTHKVEVDYRGVPMEVEYRSAVTVRTREIGAGPPTRQSTVRCTWTAAIDVERHVSRSGVTPTFSRPLAEARKISGTQPGSCKQARKSIDRAVAARSDELRGHLLAVAAEDGHKLVAELDAARSLAVN